jgi:hypothetical protein
MHRKALGMKYYFIFAPLLCSAGTVVAHFRHTYMVFWFSRVVK